MNRAALAVLMLILACATHHVPTMEDPTFAPGDMRRIVRTLDRERDSVCTGLKAIPAGVDSALVVHCAPTKAEQHIRDSVCAAIYERPISPKRDTAATHNACPKYRRDAMYDAATHSLKTYQLPAWYSTHKDTLPH